MKNITTLSVFLLMLLSLTGCEVIGDIFGAGFYTGIFVVVLIIAVIIFFIFKMKRK